MIHISAPYHADADHVFVEDTKLEPHCIPAEDFRLLGRAMRVRLVKCFYCNEPVSQLDPHYPYNAALTMCAAHAKTPSGGWLQAGRRGYWHWFQGYRSLCGNWERERLTFDVQTPTGSICAVCARKRTRKNTAATG